MQKKINNDETDEICFNVLLDEDIKVGDLIGISIEGEEDEGVSWEFYWVISTDGDNILVSTSQDGNNTTPLEQLDDENPDAYYVHIGFREERELWSPGNRNLHEIPIETVISEVFQLSNRECHWISRGIDSIAEETGLQRSRIRRSLRAHPELFREKKSGNWEMLSLLPDAKKKPINPQQPQTNPPKRHRRVIQ
jgi:hypothetical protein